MENVNEKLEQMKKTRKLLWMLSILATVAVLVMLVLFNFMPAARLTVAGTDKFGNGFSYPGWQLIFYGIGIQYIPGYYEFGFDIITCLGLFVPLIALIVCTVMSGKGKNKRKAILEFVMAAAILFGGIILFHCRTFAALVASNKGMNSFRDAYLNPAIEAGTFDLLTFPKILLVVCLIAAVVKGLYGAFLLYQRDYAIKHNVNKKSEDVTN